MKRITAVASVFVLVSLFCVASLAAEACAQSRGTPVLGLESRGTGTPAPPSGGQYMSDAAFVALINQADAMLKINDFNRAHALMTPYEVYIFGSVDHWTNMERYDWRMAQIYGRKNDMVNYIYFLKAITDASEQHKPTAHQKQFIEMVDENGASTNQFFFGAAYMGRDYEIRAAALERLDQINRSMKPFGKMDPRMKYENYPGRSWRRTGGY